MKNRITAHHGEYADARVSLEDSLELLSNVGQIYANADDANRPLCNQAFFKAIYIEEDNDIRVGYEHPYDAVCHPDLQADALTWAETARNENEVQTRPEDGSSVASLNLVRLG